MVLSLTWFSALVSFNWIIHSFQIIVFLIFMHTFQGIKQTWLAMRGLLQVKRSNRRETVETDVGQVAQVLYWAITYIGIVFDK